MLKQNTWNRSGFLLVAVFAVAPAKGNVVFLFSINMQKKVIQRVIYLKLFLFLKPETKTEPMIKYPQIVPGAATPREQPAVKVDSGQNFHGNESSNVTGIFTLTAHPHRKISCENIERRMKLFFRLRATNVTILLQYGGIYSHLS